MAGEHQYPWPSSKALPPSNTSYNRTTLLVFAGPLGRSSPPVRQRRLINLPKRWKSLPWQHPTTPGAEHARPGSRRRLGTERANKTGAPGPHKAGVAGVGLARDKWGDQRFWGCVLPRSSRLRFQNHPLVPLMSLDEISSPIGTNNRINKINRP